MTLGNFEVAQRWVQHRSAHNRSMSTDGERLYSYALCIGEWRDGWPAIFNYTKGWLTGAWGIPLPTLGYRSQSTSHHVVLACVVSRSATHRIRFWREEHGDLCPPLAY